MNIKLNESEKKVLTFWGFLAVIVISVLLVFKIVAPEKFNTFFGIPNADKKYSLVTDRTRYYTVLNSINKYYQYQNDKDAEKILEVLNSEYKDKSGLHSVADFVWPDVIDNTQMTYNARLMCQKKLDTGIYSFLVSGFESDSNKANSRGNTAYYEVTLNDNNFTFDIKPIDDKTFGGECHE